MPLTRAICSECPSPVEGRALTCSQRCRTARSRRRSSARAAESLETFEALLQDDDVSDEVRRAYAGLLNDLPGFRITNARALARGAAPEEEPAYSTDLAVQARDWLTSWVRSARPGSWIGCTALFYEAADSWHGSRHTRPIPVDLFHTVAESVLVKDGDDYRVPALD